MASTAQDQARLLVTIEATQARFAKQLAAIAKNAGDTANGIEKNFKRANDNAGRSAEDGGKRVARSFNQSRGAAQQLSFQLNDIATQLASGVSPFTIMAQQGGQVAQALNSAGGARGAVTALGAAFAGLANPIGLASVALIGIVGYATQYLVGLINDGEKSNKVIKEQADLIQKVADRWGDAVPALKAYADQLKRAQDEADLREATQLRIEDIFAGAKTQVQELRVDLADVVSQLQLAGAEEPDIIRMQKAFEALSAAVGANKDSTKENQELLSALSRLYINTGVPAANDFAPKIYAIADAFKEVAKQAAEAAEQERKALEAARLANLPNMLPGNLGQLSPLYSGGGRFMNEAEAMDSRAAGTKSQTQIEQEKLAATTAKVRDTFDGLDSVVESYVNTIIKAESGGDRFAKNPNSSATGLGQFIESTWLAMFRKEFPDRAKSMSDATILALRTDADISRKLIEAYARDNAELLRQAGVSVNQAALHLAHFLGPQGAIAVLTAKAGTPVSQLLSPAAINANPTILGGGATVDDVIAYGNRRAGAAAQAAADYKSAAQAAREFDAAQRSAAQSAEQMGQAIGNVLSSLIGALEDGKLEAHELLQIAVQLLQVFARMPGFGGGAGGFLSGLFSALGGGFATGTPNTGGQRGQPRGIVHGQEAVIPLPSGGRVPVEVRGSGYRGGGSSYAPVYNIDARGADAAAVARLERSLAERDRKFGKMVDAREKDRATRGTRP